MQATNVLLVAQLWFRIPFAGSFLTLYAGCDCSCWRRSASACWSPRWPPPCSRRCSTPSSHHAVRAALGPDDADQQHAGVLQYFTLINPLRYAIDIAQRVYLEGAGIGLLHGDLWPLALIALITLSAASWLFRHTLQ